MQKYLEERKNDLLTRAEEILATAKAETRELTEEEVKEFAEIKNEAERIRETIDAEESVRSMRPMEKKEEVKEEKALEERAINVGGETIKVREDEYKNFEAFVRGADHNMTKGDNGAVIPTTIVNWIIRKVYDICPILERSQMFNVVGKVEVPYYPADSDHITVAYANEFEDLASTSGEFASVELTGFLAGALTKISRSLVNNSSIDIVAFVVDEMALAIRRWIEHEMLIGTYQKVTGLSTLSNGIVTASASAITANEIIQLHDKIKDQFQMNACWIMSPATRTALRLLKDNVGRYLLQDDISLPFGTSILGKPVFVSDNMPDIEDGGAVIYYGDFKGIGTKFAENMEIEVLRERFATQHALGVVGWLEFDAKVIDEQQIAKLTMAGSASV